MGLRDCKQRPNPDGPALRGFVGQRGRNTLQPRAPRKFLRSNEHVVEAFCRGADPTT